MDRISYNSLKIINFFENLNPKTSGVIFSTLIHLIILLFMVGLPNFFSTKEIYNWNTGLKDVESLEPKLKILVSDFGLKYNILRILRNKGCSVEVFPSNTSASELLERNPDGIMLSPGPGNPELLDYTAKMTKDLLGRVPIMGICMGNQVLGKALGGKTYKLKFGHRGSNHPVKDY